MKAKTKLQQRVYSLSQRLAPISERQKEWAFQHCFDHYGRRTKKGTASCLECGYEWFDKTLKPGPAVCPHCGRTIEIIETRKRRFKRDEAYYCILTTCGGCQVIRFFDLYVTRHVGREAWYGCQEVVQLWITPAGKVVSIARLRPMLSWYRDSWNWSSPLEVRPYKMCYDITPGFIYPRKSVIPALRRNGFCGDLHGISPLRLFLALLDNCRAETLLKAGQYPMLAHEIRSHVCSDARYWPSVRICMRQGYLIPDASMWCDYIDLLRYFNKDVLSARYVCPADLEAEHDRLERKKRERLKKEELHRKFRQAQEAEENFRELKSRFFGISFADDTICVRVLESVAEYVQEGELMHHCVYASAYYSRPDSLILTAQIGEEHIETVEVSLKTFQVVQSRGVCNKPTEYHDRIINLVERNMDLIRRRMMCFFPSRINIRSSELRLRGFFSL